MTEMSPAPTKSDIQRRLARASQDVDEMLFAATAIRLNFDWLEQHESQRAIPLLDFDVICETLGPVGALRMAEQAEDGPDDLSIREPFGPNALNAILEDIENFCLPPGTMYELLDRKQQLKKTASVQTEMIMRKFATAVQSGDPVGSILNNIPSHEVFESVRREISEVWEDYNDLAILDSMTRRATPIEDICHEETKASKEHFDRALKDLQSTRPRHTVNNRNDALNYAVLRWMSQGFRRGDPNQKIPILISRTKQVLNLNGIQNDENQFSYSNSGMNIFQFFNNHYYLTIYTALLRDSGNNYRVAATSARLIKREIEELRDAYTLLRESLASNRIQPSDLEAPGWERVRFKRKRFLDTWRSIVRGSAASVENDRVQLLNKLLSPRIVEQLRSAHLDQIETGLRELIARLRKFRHAGGGLEETLLLEKNLRTLNEREEPLTTFFRFTLSSDPGQLLFKSPPGEDFTSINGEGDHDDRVLVHLKQLNSPGALLAIDSWRDSGQSPQRFIAVTWRHHVDAGVIWETGLSLLKSMLSFSEVEQKVHYSMYCPIKKWEGSDSLSQVESVLKTAMTDLDGLDFFKLEIAGLTYCADIVPQDEVEMQATVVIPADSWNLANTEAIARSIANTTSEEFCDHITFKNIFSYLNKVLQIEKPKGLEHA